MLPTANRTSGGFLSHPETASFSKVLEKSYKSCESRERRKVSKHAKNLLFVWRAPGVHDGVCKVQDTGCCECCLKGKPNVAFKGSLFVASHIVESLAECSWRRASSSLRTSDSREVLFRPARSLLMCCGSDLRRLPHERAGHKKLEDNPQSKRPGLHRPLCLTHSGLEFLIWIMCQRIRPQPRNAMEG